MGKVGAIIAVVFLVWLIYAGYFALNFHPRVSANWGAIEGDNIDVEFRMNLGNPSPLPLSVENVTLKLADVPVATINKIKVGFLAQKVTITSTINLDKVVDGFIAHIKNKEDSTVEISGTAKILNVIPYQFTHSTQLKTNILSYLQELKQEPKTYTIGGLLPVKTPGIEGIYAKWGDVSREGIEIIGDIKLYNQNNFPLPITNLKAELYMNDIKVGKGEIIKGAIIPAGGYGTVKVRVVLFPDPFKEAIKKHIMNGEVSRVRVNIEFYAKIAGEEVVIPVKDIETTIETNLLGSLSFS
ncbi:LEA type 2 family protein [Pyrococcus kukulkanii]|uniref:LEA type 2 family protein n=1 Tax=Pyrococcus kukulkanii TaxID=1609559 RepID=UPI00356378E3